MNEPNAHGYNVTHLPGGAIKFTDANGNSAMAIDPGFHEPLLDTLRNLGAPMLEELTIAAGECGIVLDRIPLEVLGRLSQRQSLRYNGFEPTPLTPREIYEHEGAWLRCAQ